MERFTVKMLISNANEVLTTVITEYEYFCYHEFMVAGPKKKT